MRPAAYKVSHARLVELVHLFSISELRKTFPSECPSERQIYYILEQLGYKKPAELRKLLRRELIAQSPADITSIEIDQAIYELQEEAKTIIAMEKKLYEERFGNGLLSS